LPHLGSNKNRHDDERERRPKVWSHVLISLDWFIRFSIERDGTGLPMTSTTEARALARQRSEAYRDRKRRGVVLAWIEVDLRDLAALERLALLEPGERDPYLIACAVGQFLKAAPAVAGMGDALWPARSDNG
jgi:hypothetical protein